MASILNDEDFDWDAAVRDIDVAFQEMPSHINVHGCAASAVLRQSTLDDFVDTASERHLLQPQISHNNGSPTTSEGLSIPIDPDAAKTWIYPVNVPRRDYQFNIAKTALFSNTLVALPTGLGKTLIAAVVMYNYFRWFPEGKIVFAAPSRPLVLQQIEACHYVAGIPQELAIDMTGQTSPSKRAKFWKTKRVFFLTPQVLEKDIQSGSCAIRELVCLVIDEAHRAMGNYAYCVAVRELMAVQLKFRILALTATPGSKHRTIQSVIDNLYISTLEYRNEDDYDVSQYIHNRKLELVQVAMGNDAVEIDKILLQVAQPFLARLSAFGVLEKRNYMSLHPCDLLNMREKFRHAPLEDVPSERHGEIEGYFGVLITLYHIRKLLSSHGIKPAYEMLEERLRQGSFARLMGRNEIIWQVKLLMQKSLSTGAPTPKLLKVAEILVEHFKSTNSTASRVIIFSNFRGSVKDILESLACIGEPIKATQFIGQNSGKSSKGQSQRVQQEVLQKFRNGGFNVIVATSIGEEGLDIMDVDLVICFDANISPLRMVQRMGRTGRNHDGRVVVLACEGSEIKGYTQKLVCNKTVRKHMRNGGTNSFNFHPSPRMVPHVFKPEVQFVELSIEEFVPRKKNAKLDQENLESVPFSKISEEDSMLLSKYFLHYVEVSSWKPSLVAFPHFQALPSHINEVKHSDRTFELLIDVVKQLEGLSPLKIGDVSVAVDVGSNQGMGLAVDAKNEQGECECAKASAINMAAVGREPSFLMPKEIDEAPKKDPFKKPCHRFLFETGVVSLDSCGIVHVLSMPSFPQLAAPTVNSDDHDIKCHFSHSKEGLKLLNMEDVTQSKVNHEKNEWTNTCLPSNTGVKIVEVEVSGTKMEDPEFSPRLASLAVEGIVPESPVQDCPSSSVQTPCIYQNFDNDSRLVTPETSKKAAPAINELCQVDEGNQVNAISDGCRKSPSVCEMHTPVIFQKSNSSIEDWKLNTGDGPNSVKLRPKLKRLRTKDGDRKFCAQSLNEKFSHLELVSFPPTITPAGNQMSNGDLRRCQVDINDFFEDEAEISGSVDVSEDEDEYLDEDQYEQSFINDSKDSDVEGKDSQAEELDMMAVYRRSLLSQSPQVCLPQYTASRMNDAGTPSPSQCGSCSLDRTCRSNITPDAPYCVKDSVSSVLHCIGKTFDLRHEKGSISCSRGVKESKMEKRKRKLCFAESSHISSLSRATVSSMKCQAGNRTLVEADYFGDQLYEGLDLDALEEKAMELLKCKLSKAHGQEVFEANNEDCAKEFSTCCPSFDLGF